MHLMKTFWGKSTFSKSSKQSVNCCLNLGESDSVCGWAELSCDVVVDLKRLLLATTILLHLFLFCHFESFMALLVVKLIDLWSGWLVLWYCLLVKLLSLLLVVKALLHLNSGRYIVIRKLRCWTESMLIVSPWKVYCMTALRDWRFTHRVCGLCWRSLTLSKSVEIRDSSCILVWIKLWHLILWNWFKGLRCTSGSIVDKPALWRSLSVTSKGRIRLVVCHLHSLIIKEPICVAWLWWLGRWLQVLLEEFCVGPSQSEVSG